KELLNKPIENFVKPIIYAPENKKISKLFLEFKNKKTHLAIIVNEYGGTEGIVTIEDILEEMVGEIKDEYDIEEEKQYWQLPTGSFVIDAKMNIIDLEDQLKIKIPHSPEYETIGGYIFHIAGTIPSKGWKIHLEDFDIEVLISNERCIEKIRITPASK
ncbi:MAG: transporter associated domain-containing protein, partial [Parachlamydiales bacterium]